MCTKRNKMDVAMYLQIKLNQKHFWFSILFQLFSAAFIYILLFCLFVAVCVAMCGYVRDALKPFCD